MMDGVDSYFGCRHRLTLLCLIVLHVCICVLYMYACVNMYFFYCNLERVLGKSLMPELVLEWGRVPNIHLQ